VERLGLRLTRGGRFFHITGRGDKADAVRVLIDAYGPLGPPHTIGLGDGPNDEGFLKLVDYPVLPESAFSEHLRARIPHARIATARSAGTQPCSKY
jgi:predicted mannosyl-3-phosphoglycerate phosphatase (HAD superfamily)